MGFLLLIGFAIYGLGCMCDFPECNNREKNTRDNSPASKDSRANETNEPDGHAKRPASDRPPVGTISGGMYRRTADENPDGSEISIDELEYMRRFFH